MRGGKMLEKWRKNSYTTQKKIWNKVRWIVLGFLVLYIAYTLLTKFIFSTRMLESDSMQPNLRAGDIYISSSFMIHKLLSDFSLNINLPVKRGNVVLVDLSLERKHNFFSMILDDAVRFFTLQRVSIVTREEQFYMKRVIGLPGDEITMTNYVFRIKPQGSAYALTEFELCDKPYEVTIPQVPPLWDESIPFSGNIDTFVLGEDEYFVLSDDRSNTNDSRTWGPILQDYIVGRIIFRYWPFNRFGIP